ncbi:MAG: hypothetical protein EPO22_02175 [Dehalococcoidia bacterium]|nr:MAG: hypothetical protein EPO22_02175 [Dehalococcoidia bacterium]
MNLRQKPNWSIIAPVALIVAVIGAVIWFDAATGGEAKPNPPLGEIGTPVRPTYVPPTATPFGAHPTPTPRPTSSAAPPAVSGTKDQRDAKRRVDLLLLLNAANQLKARDGSFPDTHNNVQTVCKYKDSDAGCVLKDFIDGGIPEDPLGNGEGYWMQADGTRVRFFASLENSIDDSEKCPTTDAELVKHDNLICISAP